MSDDTVELTTPSTSQMEFIKQPRLLLGAFRLLICSSAFLQDFRSILRPEDWREQELRWLAAKVSEHWDEYHVAPTVHVVRDILDADKDVTKEQHQLITRVLDKIDEFRTVFGDDFDLDGETQRFIRAEFEKHIQYRATLHAIHEAQDYVDNGDLDSAVAAVIESQSIRRFADDWLVLPRDADKFFDYFEESALARVTIPTGITPLDAVLSGGARKGELGVWVAPTGYGKSMALVHCGANAFRDGKTVVHFTFENSREETLARYLYNLLDIDSKTLPKWNKADERYLAHRHVLMGMPGKLFIMELIGSMTTAQDLAGYLNRLREQDPPIIPDLLIVDYGDFLRSARPSTRNSSKYDELQTVFEELRDLAASQDVALWTATQANREGLKGKRVLTHHIADSIGKAFVSDVIISISMDKKDKEGKRITNKSVMLDDGGENDQDAPPSEHRILHLLKLRRGGSDNWWCVAKAHYSKARFEVEDWADEPDESAVAASVTARMPTKRRRDDAAD